MNCKHFFILLFSVLSFTVLAQDEVKTDIKADIVVDRNGRGDYRSLQEAILSVRAFRPEGLTTIYVRDGVYKEKIEIPSFICNLHIIGESRENTIIDFDDHANIDNMGTFKTYTLLVRGNDICLENLTVRNSAQPLGQAVALHVEGDRFVVKNCRILGNQDTIYTGREGARMYFEDCFIDGTTDYIFGPSTCWFERCTLFCKRNSYITAASTPENIRYGYIFNHCKVMLADGITKVYLGRPWRAYAMTLFMNCELPQGITPAGWHNWGKESNEATARYMEYNNTGAGADLSKRVAWSRKLDKKQVKDIALENVMKGCDGWNPSAVYTEKNIQNK